MQSPQAPRALQRPDAGHALALLFALLLLGLNATGVRASGLVVVPEPPSEVVVRHHFPFAPLEVTYLRVNVNIRDNVATTTVEQEFYNPNPRPLEGFFLFPLPAGGHLDRFSMDVNGRMTEAELLDADKARRLYEDIVRRCKDPALLEYAGRSAFKCRIFPIEPNGRKPVKLIYTQLLKSDAGLSDYLFPLNTEKFSSRPLKDVSVRVSIESDQPLKSVYCPSHDATIDRRGERRAEVRWDRRGVRPDSDFKVVFSTAAEDVGANVVSYRTGSGREDGYFLLLASPGVPDRNGEVQARDICFVVDTSGSMAENGGKKMEQAKQALSFCLQNLNPDDRFNVIRFSTEVEPLFDKLRRADKDAVEEAGRFVDGFKPIGGTAIEAALSAAVKMREASARRGRDSNPGDAHGRDPRERDDANRDGRGGRSDTPDRPFVVIFLTDGQPTIGQTDDVKIVDAVKKAAPGSARIFSFGVGTDVNTHLLDNVASGTRAFSQYVLPTEDLEVKLSSFYTKIKEPVLTDLEVHFDGVKVSDLYPTDLPDLYRGEQLVVFGRYRGHGPAAVTLRGTFNGETKSFKREVKFAERQTDSGYIPQLWATRRVGYLLDQIRLNGESRELKDEVTRLAREHGIVTPYTAYLILEDEGRRNVPLSMQTMRELREDGQASVQVAQRYQATTSEAEELGARSGAGAVANAQTFDNLKRQSSVAAPAAAEPVANDLSKAASTTPADAGGSSATTVAGYRQASNYAQQAKVVNGRAFYQNGAMWTDATAQAKENSNLRQQTIRLGSDEYFDLLDRHPEAAAWFALGESLDIVLDDTLYQVRG